MDLDADGRTDVITGDWPGHVVFFKRQESGAFAAGVTLRHADGNELDVGSASAAFAVDWDGDRHKDLLVGNIGGTITFFKNLATGGIPRFGKGKPVLAAGRPLKVGGDAGPAVADWDGDGVNDLVVGDGRGEVRWAKNLGTNAKPQLAKPTTLVAAPSRDSGRDGRAKICVTDWNADGHLDLLVGDFTSGGTPPAAADKAARDAVRKRSRELAKQLAAHDTVPAGETAEARAKRLAQRQSLVREWAEVDLKLCRMGGGYGGRVFVFLRRPPAASGGGN